MYWGPGYASLDVTLVRRIAMGPTVLKGRVEIFNALNTANLGSPDTVVGITGFGSITSARDPRVVQVGVKLGS